MYSGIAHSLAGGTANGQNCLDLNQNTQTDPPSGNKFSGDKESFLASRYNQVPASSSDTGDRLSQSDSSGHVSDKRASGGGQSEAGHDMKGNRMPKISGNGSSQRNADVVPEPKQPLLSASGSSHGNDLEASAKGVNKDQVSFSSGDSPSHGKTDSHALSNTTYPGLERPETSLSNGIGSACVDDAYQGDNDKKRNVSPNVEEKIPVFPPQSATPNRSNNNNNNSSSSSSSNSSSSINNNSSAHDSTRCNIDSVSTAQNESQCDRGGSGVHAWNGMSRPGKDGTDRFSGTTSEAHRIDSSHYDGSVSPNARLNQNPLVDTAPTESEPSKNNNINNHQERFRTGSPVVEGQYLTTSPAPKADNDSSSFSPGSVHSKPPQRHDVASSTTSAPSITATPQPFEGVSTSPSSNGGRGPTLTSPEQVDGSRSPVRNRCPSSPLAPNTSHSVKNANTRSEREEEQEGVVLSPEGGLSIHEEGQNCKVHAKPQSLTFGSTSHRNNDQQETDGYPDFSQDSKPYDHSRQPVVEGENHGILIDDPHKHQHREFHSPSGISAETVTCKSTNDNTVIAAAPGRQHTTSYSGLAPQHTDDAPSQNDNFNSTGLIPLAGQRSGSPETTPTDSCVERISDFGTEQTTNSNWNNTATNLKTDHSTPLSTASLTSARWQLNLFTSPTPLNACHNLQETQSRTAEKPVDEDSSTSTQSSCEENFSDKDVKKEDNKTDGVDSFPWDHENPSIDTPFAEFEPLLLSADSHSNHQQLENMSDPVLESYRVKSGSTSDVSNDTGYHAVNGGVPSVEGSGSRSGLGFSDPKSKAKYLECHSESNGVVAYDSIPMADRNNSMKEKIKGGGEKDDDEDDDGGPCGWGPLHFGCCQRFRSPKWFLLVITLCGACQGMAINGFVNTVISTIEKRFEINSTESGLIASCYDIMFVLLVIPVSYFGGHGNKPRYLGIGIFILGVGSFVFSLPHFLTDNYDVGDAQDTVCKANSTSPTSCITGQGSLSNYKYFFFLGQLLHGAGATALYTLGVVYMDENVPQRSSSLYNGIFYTGAIIGPAVGYILGSEFLKIYTDLDVDPDDLGLRVNNPKWIGAWWIGFLFSGIFAFLLSIPLLAFPPALPGSKKYAMERGKESHAQEGVDKTGQHKSINDILLSIKFLLTNLPFMFINIAAAADGIIVAGFSTFMPKFIEYQFGLSSSTAALYVGLAVVPAGGGATFLGGFLVTFFNLKVKGILRLCVASAIALLLLLPTLLLNCKIGKFAGVNTQYKSDVDISSNITGGMLFSSCNINCNCQEEDYFPMCGRDGLLYFSPCYAGCIDVRDEGSSKYYYNCSCLDYNYTVSSSAESNVYDGEFGKCENQCDLLAPFMLLFSVLIVLMFITSMPSLTATLRCVPDHLRAFGLGIQWIVARCLGSIPGPILFGKMFDLACSLWQKRCNGSGSCFFYDNEDMRVNLLSVTVVFGFIAALSFFLAHWFYKAKPTDETIHIEIKRNQESFRVSQNTIVPDTPTSPNGPVGQALP